MMASLVLGTVGLKRSGKDTFAARLVEEHGFTRVAFADPLKDAALALDPRIFYRARLSEIVNEDGWEAAKEIPEVRRTLQNLGVAIRNLDPGFWLNAAIRRADEVEGPVIITDVRFSNELGYVARHGVSVRIVRPGQVNSDTHISENELADAPTTFSVVNGGTVADLHAAADELAAALTSR
jgi:hypothetical protein